jgi:hypothetical protein
MNNRVHAQLPVSNGATVFRQFHIANEEARFLCKRLAI